MPNEPVVLLMLIFVIGLSWLAKRISVPYPIVLVIAGLVLSLIPGLPKVSMSPQFIFLAVLPPLLFSTAFTTSWRDFRLNLVSICSLAFGLVGFTVFGIAFMAEAFLPGFDWRTGLVLGSIAAPTDSIAAAAIAQRVGLPRRLIDVLEGESLVNDASGLLALEFTTALVVSNRVPSLEEGVGRLLLLLVAGIGVGLLIGYGVDFIERQVDDGPMEVTLSFVTPYLTYQMAEHLHGSGILAVVAAGFYLGNRSSYHFSSSVRLQARSFWNTFGFVLNGVVFLLIGLQLPFVLRGNRSVGIQQLWFDAAVFVGAAILLRLVWVFPAGRAAHLIRQHLFRRDDEMPKARELFIEGWTGMRGAISLAAAIALPDRLADGSPFPQRNLIIVLIFSLIFVTLVVQGLSLTPLIRSLGLAGWTDADDEENMARCKMLDAALRRIEQLRRRDQRRFRDVYDDVSRQYRLRLSSITKKDDDKETELNPELLSRYREISKDLRTIERDVALRLRDEEKISDHVLRTLENELDLLDARFE